MSSNLPPTAPPVAAAGVLQQDHPWVKIRVYAIMTGAASLPFVILGLLYLFVPTFSADPKDQRVADNALLGIAGVAGVLWSGAIITYSIHLKYTPQLRTAVQLIHYCIVAPLIGLIADGAVLRSAFYCIAWFYGLSATFSFSYNVLLKPGYYKVIDTPPEPTETHEQARKRVEENGLYRFRLIAHGAWYFAFVAALCLLVVVTARKEWIAWTSIIALITSLSLILPELFSVVEQRQDKAKS